MFEQLKGLVALGTEGSYFITNTNIFVAPDFLLSGLFRGLSVQIFVGALFFARLSRMGHISLIYATLDLRENIDSVILPESNVEKLETLMFQIVFAHLTDSLFF